MNAARFVITGASGGIGAAVARAVAAPGVRIVLHYCTQVEAVHSLAVELAALGARPEPLQADLADLAAVDGFAARARALAGPPSHVVHAAGSSQFSLLQELSLSEWRRLQDLHLGAAYRLVAAFLPDMLQARFGRFVLVGSVFGLRGGAMEAGYAAAKAGLGGLARALGGEVGRSGVTVNVVAPGAIDTPMLGRLDGAEREALRRAIPLGRLGRPTDVAGAVRFLLSPDADYITGAVLPVDGGYSL